MRCVLDDRLTVHRSITLVDLQLDAQNSFLFTYNTFIKIQYMFRALPCSSSGGLRHKCIHAASGIVTLCRWLPCAPVKKERSSELSSFLTGAQDSHLQRATIPEGAYIQLWRRPPEDKQDSAQNRQWILINVLYVNKQEFCASSWRSTKVMRCFVC